MLATKEARIAEAFIDRANSQAIDLSSVRRDIAQLAKRSTIESFDVNELAVSVSPDGTFSGEGIVYFQVPGRGEATIGEELPVNFDGKLDEKSGSITFDNVEVDISPLSGG